MGCIRNEKLEKRKKMLRRMDRTRSPVVNERYSLLTTINTTYGVDED